MDTSKYAAFKEVFNHTWSDVVSGFWLKYPNQFSQHVLSEDVVEREILDNGCLRSVRILQKTNPIPSWGKMMLFKTQAVKLVHIVEESIVNPVDQKMVVYSYNISYKKMMDTQEKLTITPNDSDTQIIKEGWVDSSLKGFRRVVRNFGIQRWKTNSKKASNGFLSTLDNKGEEVKRACTSASSTSSNAVESLLNAAPAAAYKLANVMDAQINK